MNLRGRLSAASDGQRMEELLKSVSHLSSKDVGFIFRTLGYKGFENEDPLNCSRTGKKTANSRENPKPPLNAFKLEIVQTAVVHNFLKIERRKSRAASSQLI